MGDQDPWLRLYTVLGLPRSDPAQADRYHSFREETVHHDDHSVRYYNRRVHNDGDQLTIGTNPLNPISTTWSPSNGS